ncbi:hypothetical protein X772_26640 [Mesorhizobium sp. LSJC280B00]|nr:hypothetical protein X772_26640 [Mesorhizobium sp. LSJC280B00]
MRTSKANLGWTTKQENRMANFQAVVHARQEAKRELSTLRETVRILAEQRAQEKKEQDAGKDGQQHGHVNQPA